MSLSAVVGALRVMMGMDSAQFESGADSAEARMTQMQARFNAAAQRMGAAGQRLSLAVTLPLVAIGRQAVEAARESQQASAAVQAALASMGDGAGFTLDQLQDVAGELSRNSLFQDDDILSSVTANLLTFGNVSGEVFLEAQQLALDLSARLGTDLQGSAILLGKALNEPIEGLSALSRVGVAFTEDQEAMIRAMAEAGDVAGAQAIILAELGRQYGGQAAAQAATDAGRMTQAANQMGEALESIGVIILPVVTEVADKIRAVAEAFQGLDEVTQTWVVKAAAFAAALGPTLIVLGSVVGALSKLRWAVMALASPWVIVGAAVGGFVYKLWEYWENIELIAVASVEYAAHLINPWITAVSQIPRVIGEFVEALVMGFANLPQTMWEIGRDAGLKLIEGLKSMLPEWLTTVQAFDPEQIVGDNLGGMGNLAGAMAGGGAIAYLGGVNVGQNFADGVTDALDIHSPSRVMQEIGGFAMEGLTMGLTDGAAGAESAVTDVTERMRSQFEILADEARISFEGIGQGLAGVVKGSQTAGQALIGALGGAGRSLTSAGIGGFGDIAKGLWGPTGGGIAAGFLSGLMGFADGGQFRVGGMGGIDSQLVAFRASPDETVSITRPGDSFGGGGGQMALHVTVGFDDSGALHVRRVAQQEAAQMGAQVQAGMRSTMALYDRNPRRT